MGFDFTDRTPPTVRATTASQGASIQVSLSAHDAAGVAGIEYRLQKGPYAVYSAPLALAPGATVTYRAVDANGNVSAAWSLTAGG